MTAHCQTFKCCIAHLNRVELPRVVFVGQVYARKRHSQNDDPDDYDGRNGGQEAGEDSHSVGSASAGIIPGRKYNQGVMSMQIETDDYLPTSDVAEALGLGTDTVKIYCQKGILKGIKIGSQWLVDKTEIKRYKRDRKTVGRPKKRV